MVGMKHLLSLTFLWTAFALRLNDEDHANVTAQANVTEAANTNTSVVVDTSMEANETAEENSTIEANTSAVEESDAEAATEDYAGSLADSKPTAETVGYAALKQAYDTLMSEEPAAPLEWTYFPPEPRLGIVLGGLPEDFANHSFAHHQSLMLLRYAKKKGYALYVDKNISRHSQRNYHWNKIPIMHQLLDSVPYLVWMDSDVVITDLVFSLEGLLKRSHCRGAQQLEWNKYLPKLVQPETFLWMGGDMHASPPEIYKVNVNTGVIGLRRCEMAKDFLRKVWTIGELPNYWQRHSFAAHREKGEVGEWPFDQGAFWDVLAAAPGVFMKNTCVAPLGQLHSLTAQLQKSSKLRRLTDATTHWKNKIVFSYFEKLHMEDWVF